MASDQKLTNDERAFLEGVRDGHDVYPIVRALGYGWAIEQGYVRVAGSPASFDFRITDLGRAALAPTPE